jgi:hypothetical protein
VSVSGAMRHVPARHAHERARERDVEEERANEKRVVERSAAHALRGAAHAPTRAGDDVSAARGEHQRADLERRGCAHVQESAVGAVSANATQSARAYIVRLPVSQ